MKIINPINLSKNVKEKYSLWINFFTLMNIISLDEF
jgi:hypothetical protein